MDEGLARPQQLRRLVGTALWREELRKPCGRSPHGPSQWPEPFVVQAQVSQAPALKQCGIPKGIAFPLLPPMQAVQGVCSSGFSMLPAATVGGAKKTLGEYAKLTTTFVIIAMGGGSQGPSQDLGPSMACGTGDVPDSGNLGGSNG